MPGVPQEISLMVQWYWQKVFEAAPSNTHMDKVIDKVSGFSRIHRQGEVVQSTSFPGVKHIPYVTLLEPAGQRVKEAYPAPASKTLGQPCCRDDGDEPGQYERGGRGRLLVREAFFWPVACA